jgi:hypothetical protein
LFMSCGTPERTRKRQDCCPGRSGLARTVEAPAISSKRHRDVSERRLALIPSTTFSCQRLVPICWMSTVSRKGSEAEAEGNFSKSAVCERIATGGITAPNRSNRKKGQEKERCQQVRLTKAHGEVFADWRRKFPRDRNKILSNIVCIAGWISGRSQKATALSTQKPRAP